MRNYVIINGTNSLTIQGLAINILPPISKPTMRTLREEIDGRNGDIITNLGYSAYDKAIEIGLFGSFNVDDVISFFNQSGTITFSDETDKYYYFNVLEQIDFEKLIKFKTATITFHCQPFKYPLNETPLEEEYDYVEGEGTELTLNDTANAIFNKFDVLGNTSQNGTPTPSSPIPINVVSGDNEILIRGKNLEQEIELGGISQTGQNYVNNIQIRSKYYNLVEPNTTYALSFNGALSGFNVAQYDKDKTFISFTFHGGTVTTSENTRYIRINKTATLNDKVQIEKGSTATTYEPYIGNTYPLYLGVENLFDYDNTTFNNNSTGTTTKTSEYVKAIPNTTSNYSGFYVSTLPNITTTSLSFKAKADSSRTINVAYFNKSIIITLTTEWQTFKIENATYNTNSLDFYSGSDHSGVAFYVKDIQIEKGSKANSYSAYGTTPIELCKIGTYQDYIYKDNGSWYLHKEIKKVVLDGSESWEVGEYGTNSYRLSAYPYGSIIDAITVVNIITNLFRGVPFDRRVVEGDNIIYDDSNYFYIRNTSITSLANFKALLETTNMIVYYILATPTNILIEDTTLIEQLEESKLSYESQTNISQENNDLPFILSVSTLKDGSDHLVINNIGNIYAKPSLDLEGNGIVDIYLNDTQMFEVDLSETNEIVINTQEMEAYNPTTNALANRQVVGDYSKFKLDSGENDLRFSGALTKATITNYQRWL